ncbi:MAG: hypothetical protein GSR78_04900 [Desulfurococcales archaeon]|nr:hypothetical protein [Desulfurococcales archaeon]
MGSTRAAMVLILAVIGALAGALTVNADSLRVFAEMHLYPGEAGLIEFDNLEPGSVYVVKMKGLTPLIVANATIPAGGSVLSSDTVFVAFKANDESVALLVQSTGDYEAWFEVYRGTSLLWWHNYTVGGMRMPGDIGVDTWDELSTVLCVLAECSNTTVINGYMLVSDRILRVSIVGPLSNGIVDVLVPPGYSLILEGTGPTGLRDALIRASIGQNSSLMLHSLELHNTMLDIDGDGDLILDDDTGTITVTVKGAVTVEARSPGLDATIVSNSQIDLHGIIGSLKLAAPSINVAGRLEARSITIQQSSSPVTIIKGQGLIAADNLTIQSRTQAIIDGVKAHVGQITVKAQTLNASSTTLESRALRVEADKVIITSSALNIGEIEVSGLEGSAIIEFNNTVIDATTLIRSSMDATLKGSLVLNASQLTLSRVITGLTIKTSKPATVTVDKVIGSLDLKADGVSLTLRLSDSLLSRLHAYLDNAALTIIGGNITSLEVTSQEAHDVYLVDTVVSTMKIQHEDGLINIHYTPERGIALDTLSISTGDSSLSVTGLTIGEPGITLSIDADSNTVILKGVHNITGSATARGLHTVFESPGVYTALIEASSESSIMIKGGYLADSQLVAAEGVISLRSTLLLNTSIVGVYSVNVSSLWSIESLDATPLAANGTIASLSQPSRISLSNFSGMLEADTRTAYIRVYQASTLIMEAAGPELEVIGAGSLLEIESNSVINATLALTNTSIKLSGPEYTLHASRLKSTFMSVDGRIHIASSVLVDITLHASPGSIVKISGSSLSNPAIEVDRSQIVLEGSNITGSTLTIDAGGGPSGVIAVDSRIAVDTVQGVNLPIVVLSSSNLSAIDCWGVSTALIASQASCTGSILVESASVIGPVEVAPGSVFRVSYGNVTLEVAAGTRGALALVAVSDRLLTPIVLGDGVLKAQANSCDDTIAILGSGQASTTDHGCSIEARAPIVLSLPVEAARATAPQEQAARGGASSYNNSSTVNQTVEMPDTFQEQDAVQAQNNAENGDGNTIAPSPDNIQEATPAYQSGDRDASSMVLAATGLVLVAAVIIVAYMARSRTSGQGLI